MARYFYERLSEQSASFLHLEGSRFFAHSTTLLIFEPGRFVTDVGGVDFDALRSAIEARLHLAPRYRQKLRWVPIEQHPVWVDDREFKLEYHLRHTSVPRPGGAEQLKRMVARIHAQRLDRDRSPWECWVLEGIAGGRFALLFKTHHCLAEGSASGDLLQALLSPDPVAGRPEGPSYYPRPVPSPLELVWEELVRASRLPRRGYEMTRRLFSEASDLQAEIALRGRGIARLLGYRIPGIETPVNGSIGPHRRFETVRVPLADVKPLRARLDVSLNDVILAVVAGAVRSFLRERLVNPATLDFRVATPVLTRSVGGRERLDEWVIDLPVWEKEGMSRLERIRAQTRKLQERSEAIPAAEILREGEFTSPRLLALGARTLSMRAPAHLAVVNVPGSQQPLHLEGARLLETYGLTPLRRANGLAITAMSYDGNLYLGLVGDFDLLPDIERFATALRSSFRELAGPRREGSEGHLRVVEDG